MKRKGLTTIVIALALLLAGTLAYAQQQGMSQHGMGMAPEGEDDRNMPQSQQEYGGSMMGQGRMGMMNPQMMGQGQGGMGMGMMNPRMMGQGQGGMGMGMMNPRMMGQGQGGMGMMCPMMMCPMMMRCGMMSRGGMGMMGRGGMGQGGMGMMGQGGMGQGGMGKMCPKMMRSGMMGQDGMRGRMMGQGGMGMGMMNRNRKGMGGKCPSMMHSGMMATLKKRSLTSDEAVEQVKVHLNVEKNPNLKMGAVTEEGNYFVVEVTTQGGETVHRIQVDKNHGWFRSAYDAPADQNQNEEQETDQQETGTDTTS